MRKLPVVPICRRFLLLLFPPNHKHHPRCPASMKRGVTADRHETWVRDAMDAGGVERAHVARTNDADADGEGVWSWRPDAGAKFLRSNLSGTTGAREPGPRGERAGNRNTIAQGRPDDLTEP